MFVFLDHVEGTELSTIDSLARLQLIACRLGASLRVHGASAELSELIELAGLAEVLPCRGPAGNQLGPPGLR